MGGGRDFLGRRVYRKVGGRYERVVPLKKDLLSAVANAEDINQLQTALENLGLQGKTDFLNTKEIPFENMKEVSTGLSKMVAKYGSDMFSGIDIQDDAIDILGEASNDRIILNKRWLKYEDLYKPDKSGFHPANYGFDSIVMHEYGHLLHNKLGRLDPDVKGEIEKYDKFKKDYQDMDSRTDGLLKQYSDLFEKWRMTGRTKVKTREKLYLQMEAIREQALNKFGLTESGLNEFKRFVDLGQNSEKLIDIIGPNNAENIIHKIFTSIGMPTTRDVATNLTGKADAYASKNWLEAHAECVADYMTNGRNASAVSARYVREMDKYFKIRS